MQAFLDTARVRLTEEGIEWYEQDILFSKYRFTEALQIDILLKYVKPGFGIAIVEDHEYEKITDNQHSYICRIGNNEFSVFERHVNLGYNAVSTRTNIMSPSSHPEAKLRFTFKNKVATLKLITDEVEYVLGEHGIERTFQHYYVGLYSVSGNVVRSCTFLQGVPEGWHTSINNVHGGRIAFLPAEYGFQFENCIHDAELEQKSIPLPAGTYYLDYKTEEIDGKFDIEGTVYPSYIYEIPGDPKDPIDEDYLLEKAIYDGTWFEDKGKNLLGPDKSFTLYRDTDVILSFKGTQGKVTEICIKDNPQGEFIATEGEIVKSDGSWLGIILDDLKSFRFEGIVWSVPEWTDHTQLCPYGIVSTVSWNLPMESIGMRENAWYNFEYTVSDSTLTVIPQTGNIFTETYVVKLTEEDKNILTVFKNLRGQIKNLVLKFQDDSELNISVQQIYKQLVPGNIKGPIIVTDDNDDPYDLSASYREVIDGDWIIESFKRTDPEIRLSHKTAALHGRMEVYGLPAGTTTGSGTTIQEYIVSGGYDLIPFYQISVTNNVLTLADQLRNDYERIAVRYQSADTYTHLFTLYEREVFDNSSSTFVLAKPVNKMSAGIMVYGIPKYSQVNEKYLYRVPDADAYNSIDYCCETYTLITPEVYRVNLQDNLIIMNSDVLREYEAFIVDYLKANSYCINWNEEAASYEVDITTDSDKIIVHYENNMNGVSSDKVRTEILPNQNKFIILRRKEGEIF